ncbi:MAG: hypothetical protein ABL882_11235 [Sphingopyxis sp.]
MVSEVDLQIERANAALERARNRSQAPSIRQGQAQIARAKRFALMLGGGMAGLFALAIVWSLVFGAVSALGIIMLMIAGMAVFIAAGLFSRAADVRLDSIAQGPLLSIADKADRWLAQQRAALPAPAQSLSDQIGARIAALRPQLETLDAGAPEAVELRRLVGEELPDLVTKYSAVPKHLRAEERNGRVPEAELIAGLRLLDGEIEGLSKTLGVAEMDKLSSQKRYLELRYQGDEGAG